MSNGQLRIYRPQVNKEMENGPKPTPSRVVNSNMWELCKIENESCNFLKDISCNFILKKLMI